MQPRAGALAAVFVSAAVVFAVVAAIVAGDPRPAADTAVLGIVEESAQQPLVSVAEGPLDALAQPQLVVILALVPAAALLWLRSWVTLAALVLGLASTGWGGTELKEAFDRARPAYNLDEAGNQAFPSGHARFSFFWTWLGFAVAAHVPLRAHARWLIVALGVGLTAAGGLARVYIGAHWMTDVLGGWAFSAMTFTGAALVAMAWRRGLRG